jgi:hypothetical protein
MRPLTTAASSLEEIMKIEVRTSAMAVLVLETIQLHPGMDEERLVDCVISRLLGVSDWNSELRQTLTISSFVNAWATLGAIRVDEGEFRTTFHPVE